MTDTTNTAPAPAGGAEAPASSASTFLGVLAERRAVRENPDQAAPAPAQAAPADTTPPAGQAETTEPGAAAEPPASSEAPPEPAASPAAKAPAYWSNDAKARFADLPSELQAVVLEQEGGRERGAQKAKQEASDARKTADKEAGDYRDRASRLGELLPQFEAAVASKWEGVTPEVWAEMAVKDPAATTVLRARYDAEMAKLETARGEVARAETEAHGEHLKTLVADLPQVAPDLADAKEGSKRLKATFGYLNQAGVSNDQLKWATAGQLGIAYKAMLYDQGQAALKAAATKTEPKSAAPAIRATTPAAPGASSQQRLAGLDSKAARSGSFKDVLAARSARRAAAQKG